MFRSNQKYFLPTSQYCNILSLECFFLLKMKFFNQQKNILDKFSICGIILDIKARIIHFFKLTVAVHSLLPFSYSLLTKHKVYVNNSMIDSLIIPTKQVNKKR